MRSQAYWAERATQRMQKVEQVAGRYEAKIIRAYRRTVKHINADVEKLMRRYMWEFGLTEEEALELLNEKVSVQEIKLLQSRLELVKDPKVKKEIAKKIEAKAYAYRMSRLEAVKVDMRMHMEGLKETSHEILTQALQDVSRESRRLLIKDLDEQAAERGLSIQFGKFDKAVFDTITKERWYGKNYSERVWTNLGKLEKTMYNTWLDGVIQGDSNQRIAKQLSEQMNVGIYAAKRLVRTETCHYTNQIAKKEFEDDGITKYEFSAHLDKRTSDLCRDLDGKVFNVADAMVGKNYPPMHPHCRSVAVAWFGDEEVNATQAYHKLNSTSQRAGTLTVFNLPTVTSIKTNAHTKHGQKYTLKRLTAKKYIKIKASENFTEKLWAILNNEYGELKTNKVILTSAKDRHIHRDAYNFFTNNYSQIITNPDVVIHNKKQESSVMLFKKMDEKHYICVPVWLAQKNKPYTINTIPTAHMVRNSELERLRKKFKVLLDNTDLTSTE